MKKPIVTLTDFRRHHVYKGNANNLKRNFQVHSMVNTISLQAGSWLRKKEVKDLIEKGWTVKIRKPTKADIENPMS